MGSRIKTFRARGLKTFRKLYYDTDHYLPISPKDVKDFEDVIEKNHLPKMDNTLFNIFRVLSKKEKDPKDFTDHDLKDFIEQVARHEEQYPERAANIRNFIERLDRDKIITPVRKLTEFIEGDLKATDPRFLGTIVSTYQRTDIEHKKVTNTPITGKKPYMKLLLILMGIVMIAVIGYWAYSSGALNHLIPQIGGSASTPATSQNSLMQKYPTPESMKAAIDRGELSYDTLPPDMKKFLGDYKPPQAAPIPSNQH